MKKILLGFIIFLLLVVSSFAYTASQKDELILQKVYDKLDDIYEVNPARIQRIHEVLPRIQEKYKDQERISYLFAQVAAYVEVILIENEILGSGSDTSEEKALRLTNNENKSVKLSWDAIGDSVGYSIYRNGKWIAGSSKSITEFTDTNVEIGNTYVYKVSSRNSNDKEIRVYTLIGEESIMIESDQNQDQDTDESTDEDNDNNSGGEDYSHGMKNLTDRGIIDTRGVKAFPGAEGGGQDATGGRGGNLYIVNTRDCSIEANDGKISIREALEAVGDVTEGPRYITFSVGGLFDCGKQTRMKVKGDLTLACQTAPSPGVQIAAYRIEYNRVQNVIVRGCQFFGHDYNGDAASTVRVVGGNVGDLIFDHLNVLHTPDDTTLAFVGRTTKGDFRRITLSNSIIAEGDAYSTHNESTPQTGNENRYVHASGPGCAASAGVKGNRIFDCSFIGNLMAHNARRNPKFWNTSGEVIGNYIYNFQETGIHVLQREASKVNVYIEDNIVKYGPNTKPDQAHEGYGLSLRVTKSSAIQMKNNKRILTDGTEIMFPERQDTMIQPKLTFNTTYKHSCVGTPHRDDNIKRILKEVVDGTGEVGIGTFGNPLKNDGDPGRHWLNNPNYYPKTEHGSLYDTDKDGMADDWERANGLVVGEEDYNEDKDRDGYTNLEEYINSKILCK